MDFEAELNNFRTGSVLERFYPDILNCGKSKIRLLKNFWSQLQIAAVESTSMSSGMASDFSTLVQNIDAIWGIQYDKDELDEQKFFGSVQNFVC